MGADWVEVSSATLRRQMRGRSEVYDVVEKWLEKGWRLRKQGHKFAIWPPQSDAGVRLMPPFVRIDGTPRADAKAQARTINRNCSRMEQVIAAQRDEQ